MTEAPENRTGIYGQDMAKVTIHLTHEELEMLETLKRNLTYGEHWVMSRALRAYFAAWSRSVEDDAQTSVQSTEKRDSDE